MRHKRLLFLVVTTLALSGLVALQVAAQEGRVRLNLNVGTTSDIWEVQGEPSLVINGFDLAPTSLRLPVVIESASIDLSTVVPNSVYDAVVYQDPNGGSPVDAEIIGFEQFTIAEPGVRTIQFDPPVVAASPIVWIGFYMPVGTEFRSDNQGTSVRTYWAWTPENTFNLRSLGNAQVLGPSDGSAPVNLNIGGIARITAIARTANAASITDTSANVAREFFGEEEAERATDFLTNYPGCATLFYDTGDVNVTYRNAISATCRELESWNAPRSPAGLVRRSNARNVVYDVTFYDSNGEVYVGNLPEPISHCVTPAQAEQPEAQVGLAYGAPKAWDLLASEQIGNLVCTEIFRGGLISYFTPN